MLINRFAGVLLNLLINIPLLLVQTLLVLLFFVDDLLAGQYKAALLTLLRTPLNILKMLFTTLPHIMIAGWGIGVTGFFEFSFARIRTYWIDFYNTDANYFSALFSADSVDFYKGKYIGAVAHKFQLLFYPSYFLDFYKNYHHSPHSPVVMLEANQLYDLLDEKYGAQTKARLAQIPAEMEAFLNSQTSAPEDLTVTYARNSLKQLQTGVLSNSHNLKIKENHHLFISAINVVYLLWTTIQEHPNTPARKLALKQLLLTYMANIQRNLSTSPNSLDLEECGVGTINSLLGIAKAIDPAQFTLKLSKTDSWMTIRTLLNQKMNDDYQYRVNMKESYVRKIRETNPNSAPPPSKLMDPPPKKEFVESRRLSLQYYGRFLNNTPQGMALTGVDHLPDDAMDDLTNTVLEEWSHNGPSC